MVVEPDVLLFTQDSIKNSFQAPRDHQKIDDAVDAIVRGNLKARDFPRLRIVSYAGRLWSVDNRRLWVFKKAEVPVITVKLVNSHPRLTELIRSRSGLMKRMMEPDYWPRVRGDCRKSFHNSPHVRRGVVIPRSHSVASPVIGLGTRSLAPAVLEQKVRQGDPVFNYESNWTKFHGFLVETSKEANRPEVEKEPLHIRLSRKGQPITRVSFVAKSKDPVDDQNSVKKYADDVPSYPVDDQGRVDKYVDGISRTEKNSTLYYLCRIQLNFGSHRPISDEIAMNNLETVVDIPHVDTQNGQDFWDAGEEFVERGCLLQVQGSFESSSRQHELLKLYSILPQAPEEILNLPNYERKQEDEVRLCVTSDCVLGNGENRSEGESVYTNFIKLLWEKVHMIWKVVEDCLYPAVRLGRRIKNCITSRITTMWQ